MTEVTDPFETTTVQAYKTGLIFKKLKKLEKQVRVTDIKTMYLQKCVNGKSIFFLRRIHSSVENAFFRKYKVKV